MNEATPGKSAATVKSAAAFRTIGEVAQELELQQHVLRFWESKFAEITPMKRNGGRRYYRPDDIALLRRIRDLLHQEGYTIKGVQKLLRDEGNGPSGKPVTAAADVAMPNIAPSREAATELRGIIAELDDLKSLLSRALAT